MIETQLAAMHETDLDTECSNFFGADPLLLACIQHRIHSDKNFGLYFYREQEVNEILSKATSDDYNMTNNIKQYYSNKYMIRQLCDGNLTEYKIRTLQFFTHKDYYNVPNKYVSIAYKLPFFYDHDIKLNKMFKENASEELVYSRGKKQYKDSAELIYLGKLDPFSKAFPHNHYWFKSNEGYMYMFKYKSPDPLLLLFEKILNINGKIKVIPEKTSIIHKTFYEHKYYEFFKVEFDYE